VTPTASPTTTAAPEETKIPEAGTVEKSKDGTASYKVTGTTKDDKGNEVAAVTYTAPEGKAAKATTATVPAEVVLEDGSKAMVTEIAPKAFCKNKKLKKITIGKNIRKIGKNAFFGCKNLKKITVKSKYLTKKAVGKGAFKNINKKAVFYIPKSATKKQQKNFKAAIKNGNAPKTAKVKKK
jgi:hypothetical protein